MVLSLSRRRICGRAVREMESMQVLDLTHLVRIDLAMEHVSTSWM